MTGEVHHSQAPPRSRPCRSHRAARPPERTMRRSRLQASASTARSRPLTPRNRRCSPGLTPSPLQTLRRSTSNLRSSPSQPSAALQRGYFAFTNPNSIITPLQSRLDPKRTEVSSQPVHGQEPELRAVPSRSTRRHQALGRCWSTVGVDVSGGGTVEGAVAPVIEAPDARAPAQLVCRRPQATSVLSGCLAK